MNRTLRKCLLSIALILLLTASAFVFASCESEPTETVTVVYEEREDGILITGYEGVLASDNELKIPSSINGKDVVAIADGAFEKKDDLRSVFIPSTVVAIGEGAFKNCKNLVSVNIPENVTEIRSETFYGCKSITEINIPGGVTSIASDAFEKCESIVDLTVPGWAIDKFELSSLKSLNIKGDIVVSEGMLAECDRLTTLTIPYVGSDITGSDKTHFGYIFGAKDAASNNGHVPTTLTKVVITGGAAENLKMIDDQAFYGCSSITTVMLPQKLETVGISAFEGCSSLTKINIPASVTYIGEGAFANTNIESATIPSSIESIGERTFFGCDNLASITLGKNVKTVGNDAFTGCTALEALYVSSIEQWLAFSFDSHLDSPLYYAGTLYVGGKSLENIVIPESITAINPNAFYRCTNVKSLTLHNGIESIGDYAFAGCTSLESVKAPGGTEGVLPSSLTSIGVGAFSNCNNMKTITIPESVKTLGAYAFNLCTSLKELTLNADITEIGEATFRGAALTDITVNSPISTVGEKAFSECTRVKRATAPLAVIEAIRKTSLEEVTVTGGTALTNELFLGATRLTIVTLPDSVTSIGDRAFMGCTSLRRVNVNIEDSLLESIGAGAFANCERLTRFSLPASLSTIEDGAFAGCYRLKEIYSLSSIPVIAGEDGFGGISKYAFSIKAPATPSDYIESGNYLFYINHDELLLVGYFGKNSVISLPVTAVNYKIAPYAFANSNISVITIPSVATSCDESSFMGTTSLVEIEAPVAILNSLPAEAREGVKILNITDGTTVDYRTLNGYKTLSTLKICASVNTVSAFDLAMLESLASITVDAANTVYESVDGHLYKIGTSGDTLVRACPMTADYFTLATTVVEIGEYAFYNCDLLTSVYIERGSVLNKIGDYAFADSDILYSLELPATISEIGECAFYLCDYLSDIEIDGESARYATSGGWLIDKAEKAAIFGFGSKVKMNIDGKDVNVSSCVIPSDGSVLKVINYALVQQNTVQRIVIPAGVEIGEYAFGALPALEYIEVDGANTEFKVVDGCLINPETKELVLATLTANIPTDASVTTIRQTAFMMNTAITSVSIPECITDIDMGAFAGCTSLTSVTAPAWAFQDTYFINVDMITSATVIGAGEITADTFKGYTALNSITISKDITNVEVGAFKDCTALTKISVNAENTSIKAVDGCLINLTTGTLITAVYGKYDDGREYPIIPDGTVTKIGAYAFAGKENFAYVSIPGSVTEIDPTAFEGTTGLVSVAIPAEFANLVPAEKVTSLTLYGTTLAPDALDGYISLQSINIGKTVASIDAGAIVGRSTLTRISVDSENPYYTAKSGALIYVPEKLMIAGIGNCTVPVDGSVTSIGAAFVGNTTVTSIVIPEGVSVSDNAFEGCTSLNAVYYAGDNWDAFADRVGCPDGVRVYLYSATQPTEAGDFWYIENGTVKIWW